MECLKQVNVTEEYFLGKVNSAQLAAVVFIGLIGVLMMMILGMYFYGSTKRNYAKEMGEYKLLEIQMLEQQHKQVKL